MKFLVLFLATAAFASASFISGKYNDIKEDGTKWNSLVSKQFGEVWNQMEQQNKYELGFFGKLRGQGFYGQEYKQYDMDYYYNVLMKVFDRKVLKNILDQQQIYYQEMYGQFSYEKMWDMIFTHEGIFDYEYLVEIISNEVLRNWFVQHGFFDKVVLDQLLYTYQTKGTYDQYLFERLFNTQTLKYFFIKHGVSAYDILGQTSYNQYNAQYYYNVLMKVFDRKVLKNILDQEQIYNQEMYGQFSYEKLWDMIFNHEGVFDYEYLVQIISNDVLRNWFVQHGFFDKVVLDQLLYTYQTKGFYDQHLFERLFNTQTLKYYFINHRISVYDILGQASYKQYSGKTFFNKDASNVLYKNKFFQATPRMTYNHVFGFNRNVPEYTRYMYGGNYLGNSMYGQQYYGYNNGPYNYGKSFYPYALYQQVY